MFTLGQKLKLYFNYHHADTLIFSGVGFVYCLSVLKGVRIHVCLITAGLKLCISVHVK